VASAEVSDMRCAAERTVSNHSRTLSSNFTDFIIYSRWGGIEKWCLGDMGFVARQLCCVCDMTTSYV